MPNSSEINWAVSLIKESSRLFGINDAFFVGGYPRTLAMGTPLSSIHDLDVGSSSPESAQELAGFVAEKSKGTVQNRHRSGAVTVDMGVIEADFQGPAAHEHTLPYLHAWGLEPTPLAMNIFDRDFTINSLAIPINGPFKIIDLTERGLNDIEAGRIATIVPPDDIIARDPIIIARAIRFACKYNYSIDGLLWKAIKAHKDDLLKGISPHRIGIEMEALSKYEASEELLKDAGLSELIKPKGIKVASSGQDFYKEEVVFFPSKKKYESAYVCYVTATLAEEDTYVITAYLVESYLGRYAFRKDVYMKNADAALEAFERFKTKVLDIKQEFIKKPHAQAELTGYLRRSLQNEASAFTPACDQVATYLNPKNNIQKGSFGTDNNISLKNTDKNLKNYTIKGDHP